MTIKTNNLAIRLVREARRRGETLGTSGLGGLGEHRHIWKQKNAGERVCKKCGMQQRKYAGLWL